MKPVYIVHAKRTPIGRIGGGLSNVRVDDLMALLFADFVKDAGFAAKDIDDIVVGCANQAGEDNRNLGRMAGVLAGIPFEVPATTINRLCGSSLDAVIDACGRINLGLAECVLVGGAESMTRAPLVISKSGKAFGRDAKMYDSSFGWRFPNPKMEKMFPLYSMGQTAENVAEKFKIEREKQDQFALESHQKALRAWNENSFAEEVLPVPIKDKNFAMDEGPRLGTNLQKLAKLRAVFKEGGSVTAGNSSSLNDGAAMLVLVSETFLKRNKLEPVLEITGMGVRGLHPDVMGLGPVEAAKLLAHKYHKKVADFDVVELNEAFAAQALACIEELELDPAKINLNGGAIALGHPLGCSGARILCTLTHIMKNDPSLKEGLATMCIGVGQGIAVSVRRC